MINDAMKNRLKVSIRIYARALKKSKAARIEMIETMRDAKEQGATLAELGSMIGVSRQRVHQMLGGKNEASN